MGQNCTKRQVCTRGQNCTKTILHKLKFCTEGYFCTRVKKKTEKKHDKNSEKKTKI